MLGAESSLLVRSSADSRSVVAGGVPGVGRRGLADQGGDGVERRAAAAAQRAEHDPAHAETGDVEHLDAVGLEALERQRGDEGDALAGPDQGQGVLEAVVGVGARGLAAEVLLDPADRLGVGRGGVDAEPCLLYTSDAADE